MLSGSEIIRNVELNNIIIDPFNAEHVNPNSYNLTLADELLVYTDSILDCKKDNKTRKIKIPKEGYILAPGELYLGRTAEYTKTENYIPMLSGRSSIGRVGLTVHISAGLGAVGYEGYWTLGITSLVPVKVFPGMEIGQIYYYPIVGDSNIKYLGKYAKSQEINSSKIFKEFIRMDK